MDLLAIWYAITLLGTPEYWAILALVLAAAYFILRYSIPENPSWKRLRPGFRKFLVIFIPSIFLFLGLALIIKTVWFVQRPCVVCPETGCNPFCPEDSSFPSGHAGTSFVIFASLYLTFRKRLILPLFIIPSLISYSRIALGVHTWVDVLGGAVLGLFLAVLVSIINQKKHKSR
jgi:membrane-associated phospholipid phosphatase